MTEDDIARVEVLIQNDRRCKLRDKAVEFDILTSVVHEIMQKKIEISKNVISLCSKETDGKKTLFLTHGILF